MSAIVPAYEPAMKGDGLDELRARYILETFRDLNNHSGHIGALPELESLINALIYRKLLDHGLISNQAVAL